MNACNERQKHEIKKLETRYLGYHKSIFLGIGNPRRFVKHLWRHHWYGFPRDDIFYLIMASPGMRSVFGIYK